MGKYIFIGYEVGCSPLYQFVVHSHNNVHRISKRLVFGMKYSLF